MYVLKRVVFLDNVLLVLGLLLIGQCVNFRRGVLAAHTKFNNGQTYVFFDSDDTIHDDIRCF